MLWGFTFLMIFRKLVHHLKLFAPVDQPDRFAVCGALLFLFDCSAEHLYLGCIALTWMSAEKGKSGGCENTQSSITDANMRTTLAVHDANMRTC